MNKRIVTLDVDRDGWTKNLQLNIVTLDENGNGMGFRLAGPKYNGSSTNLLRTELDDRDAKEIRQALNTAFPQPEGPNSGEVLADVVAAALRDYDRGVWDDGQIEDLRTALFEYRDRAEQPAAGLSGLFERLGPPSAEAGAATP